MSRKNIILGIILIILVAVAYIYQGPWQEWRAKKNEAKNFLSGVDVEAVDRIEITRNGQTTALVKIDDRWKVDGTKDFYVKESVADNLINSLKDAVKAEVELVSANKDKKSSFETDEANGIQIVLKQGEDKVADFIVGKTANDYRRVYISQPDKNETYLLKAGLRSAVAQSEWRDKTIFSSPKDKITKIRFQYPTRELTIEKKDGKWQGVLPYAFKVDEDKIKKVLEIMSDLTAVKIPEQKFEGTGLEKHLIIVQATGEGIDNTLMIGEGSQDDKDDKGQPLYYYAKRGDSDNIYLITREQRDELDKRIRDLR